VLTDPTTPDANFAKVNMAVRNVLANRRVEDEQDWKDRRQVSDAAEDPRGAKRDSPWILRVTPCYGMWTEVPSPVAETVKRPFVADA
jgi:hypothetical protein